MADYSEMVNDSMAILNAYSLLNKNLARAEHLLKEAQRRVTELEQRQGKVYRCPACISDFGYRNMRHPTDNPAFCPECGKGVNFEEVG